MNTQEKKKETMGYVEVISYKEVFNKRFKGLIEKADIKDFCERIGTTEATAWAWSRCSCPEFGRVCMIADYFGISTDYLCGRDRGKS